MLAGAACNPLGSVTAVDSQFGERTSGSTSTTYSWNFSTASNYSVSDSAKITLGSGAATLGGVTQTFASESGFSSGTHQGTYYNANTLTLRDSSDGNLSSSWTPQYSSLVAYYPLDGTKGTLTNGATELASVGSNGTASNANATSFSRVNGRIQQAAYFDGVDDHFYVADVYDMGTQSFSISAWVNSSSTAAGNNNGIVYKRGTSTVVSEGYRLNMPAGKFNFHVADGAASTSLSTVGSTYNDGKWHHVVAVRDRTTSKLLIYVDGALETSLDDSVGNIDSTSFFGIGALDTNGINMFHPFTGMIDEVAVFGTALTAGEVSTIYARQSIMYADHTNLDSSWTPQYSSIKGYWKMDGTWQDSVGTNHGTAVNSPTFSTSAKVGSHAFVGVVSGAGSGPLINVGSSANLHMSNAVTVAAWIKPASFSEQGLIIRNGLSTDVQYSLFLYSDAKLLFQYRDGGAYAGAYSTSTMKLGYWQHVVAVRTSTNILSFYINGVLDRTVALTQETGGGGVVAIGASSTGTGQDFDGAIDDVAVWATDLTAQEVATIYNRQKQGYAGQFTSATLDTQNTSADWSGLAWTSTLPFFKELTGSSGSESSSDYSATGGSLMSGLVGLWHMDETSWNGTANEAKDSSGNDHHMKAVNSATTTSAGILGYAGNFDSTSGGLMVSDHPDFDANLSEATFSFWIYPKTDGSFGRIFSKMCHDGANFLESSWDFSFNGQAEPDSIVFTKYTDGTNSSSADFNTTGGSNIDLPYGQWSHVAMSWNGSSIQWYYNGVAQQNVALPGAIYNGTADLNISSRGATSCVPGASTYTQPFPGYVDEVAIWNRVLTASEITEVYRRAANRIRFQVRTCDDSACSGESWKGPDNTSTTWFSELHNCTGLNTSGICNFALGETLKLNSPSLEFADFASVGSGLSLSSNRYFQYQLLMEAETNTTTSAQKYPSLSSISVLPAHIYTDSPSVYALSGPAFKSIKTFSATISGSCTVTYQLSLDQNNWFYFNGSAWATASSVAQSSSADTLNSNISTFADQVGTGSLYFKAYLTASTGQTCALNSVGVTVGN